LLDILWVRSQALQKHYFLCKSRSLIVKTSLPFVAG
jgi:hypothetical protein